MRSISEYVNWIKSLKALAIENLKKNNELIYANVFHDSIKRCDWMKDGGVDLSPGRMAVGYPYLYVVYRTLNEMRPKNILELGLGQSTKLIGEYMKNNDSGIVHKVIEHDNEWIKKFESTYKLCSKSIIKQLELVDKTMSVEGEEIVVKSYTNFKSTLQGEKYDFISIDGPFGSSVLSRIDILDIVPDCLNDSFFIVMDDCQREGELNTISKLRDKLDENQVKYEVGSYSGEKTIYVIVSSDLKYMTTL